MSENQLEQENKSNSIDVQKSSKNSEPSEESKINNINLDNGDKKKKYADMFNKLKDKIVESLKTEKEKFNQLNSLEKYTTFKKFVKEFREKNEQELYKSLTIEQRERQAIKEKQIKEVIESLNNKKDFTAKDVAKIKDLALTENGFLKNEYRKRFYRFLFMIENSQKSSETNRYHKQIKLLYKDPEKEGHYYKKLKNIYRKNSEEERQHKIVKSPSAHQVHHSPTAECYTSIFEDYKQVKYDNIIEVDVKRTIFNSIFNTEKEKVMLDYLKEKITQKLKNFFSLDDNYKYYQGFHDIAIFIYILILSENEAVSGQKHEEQEEEDDDILLYEILQRMAEFYLKDYLAEITIKNLDNNDNVISTTKSAFRFDNIYRIINDIKKNVDNKIYELIQNKSDFPDPIYTLPWALTYFTHDIKNINIIYRIFDFVLFEHPASIFYLAANVIFSYII